MTLLSSFLQHHHKQGGHSGEQHTLSFPRESCWIWIGMTTVQYYVLKCARCALRRAKLRTQLMADLPPGRIATHAHTFSHTRIDYFRPFKAKLEHRNIDVKLWRIIFTCLTMRAVHLYVVKSLSTRVEVLDGHQEISYFLKRSHCSILFR